MNLILNWTEYLLNSWKVPHDCSATYLIEFTLFDGSVITKIGRSRNPYLRTQAVNRWFNSYYSSCVYVNSKALQGEGYNIWLDVKKLPKRLFISESYGAETLLHEKYKVFCINSSEDSRFIDYRLGKEFFNISADRIIEETSEN